jgi:hypothetical protein
MTRTAAKMPAPAPARGVFGAADASGPEGKTALVPASSGRPARAIGRKSCNFAGKSTISPPSGPEAGRRARIILCTRMQRPMSLFDAVLFHLRNGGGSGAHGIPPPYNNGAVLATPRKRARCLPAQGCSRISTATRHERAAAGAGSSSTGHRSGLGLPTCRRRKLPELCGGRRESKTSALLLEGAAGGPRMDPEPFDGSPRTVHEASSRFSTNQQSQSPAGAPQTVRGAAVIDSAGAWGSAPESASASPPDCTVTRSSTVFSR